MDGELFVTFHGTRGSVPTPEPGNARYGGNTSCVEVRGSDGSRILLDAGTGIRRAAQQQTAHSDDTQARSYDIFLTHFHWDHIQGLPFFPPLLDPAARVRIHAPPQDGATADELLDRWLAPVFFPVPFGRLGAQTSVHTLEEDGCRVGSLEVTTLLVQHPSATRGVRVRSGGSIVVYVPDNELAGCARRRAALVDFAAGADLLVHDAMFTGAEYARRTGWGHSTFEQATELAREAGVRQLLFFHHDPLRSDGELDGLVAQVRRVLAAQAVPLRVSAAREGQTVSLPRVRQ